MKEGDFIVRNFRFQHGETLPELRLHYVTLGMPKRDSAGHVTNAALLLHGTNGSRKPILEILGSQIFESGQPLDSAKYYLIVPDALGCAGSSKPSDGLRASFPRYGYSDMVEAQKLLVTEGLGIDHLRLILGLSMDAMHTWIWGEQYPDMIDALMPLVSLPGPITGHNLLWRRMITESIRNDPDYNDGNYVKQPSHWLFTLPGQYIMTESRVRLYKAAPSRAKAIALFDKIVDDARRLDANDYLYGYEASWDYDPESNLGKIKARLLAVNFADDMANALELGSVERAVAKIPNARSVIVPASDKSHGHFGSRYPELWKHLSLRTSRNLAGSLILAPRVLADDPVVLRQYLAKLGEVRALDFTDRDLPAQFLVIARPLTSVLKGAKVRDVTEADCACQAAQNAAVALRTDSSTWLPVRTSFAGL